MTRKLPGPLDYADYVLHSAADSTLTIKFGELWATQPVAVIFLRRLGCRICRVYAQEVEDMRLSIENMGGIVVCLTFESFGAGSDADR